MENKNNETKTMICASDLVNLFASKFKVIVIIGLIVAILGGGWGVLFTSINAKYRAEINISVSPVDNSDRLLFDLRSGRFAETLLLEENGLPAEDKCDPKDYANALAAIKAFEEARELRWEKYVEKSNHHVTDVENTYKRLLAEYEEAFNLLKMYKDADGEAFVNNAEHLAMIDRCEENLLKIQAKKQAYYDEYYVPATDKLIKLQAEYTELCDRVIEKRREAEAATEKVLAEWRKLPEVSWQINKIMESVTYEYFESNTPTLDETGNPLPTLDKRYINVVITVPTKNVDFANKLVSAYKTHLCNYAEKQIEEIYDQADVECVIIDPVICLEETVDEDIYIAQAIKYAVVFGLAAAVLTYVLMLFKLLIDVNKKNHNR